MPLTPLIDVVFILIIFFMLTTSFMKVESMELLLPSSKATKNAERTSVVHITLQDNGSVIFGKRAVTLSDLQNTLKTLLGNNPDQRIVILSAPTVSLQRLVEMMDLVYLTGGKSVYIKSTPGQSQASAP